MHITGLEFWSLRMSEKGQTRQYRTPRPQNVTSCGAVARRLLLPGKSVLRGVQAGLRSLARAGAIDPARMTRKETKSLALYGTRTDTPLDRVWSVRPLSKLLGSRLISSGRVRPDVLLLSKSTSACPFENLSGESTVDAPKMVVIHAHDRRTARGRRPRARPEGP
jgi:hypothetical protein